MTLQEFWNEKEKLSASKQIEYKGRLFSGGVYSNGYMLWYDDGLTSIPTDDIVTFNDLEKRCDEYVKGNWVCIRCKKSIPRTNRNEIERWFASVYCKDCFTPEEREERDWDYAHLD